MLKPGKHLNPQLSVIHIGGLIIKELKNNGILKFDELLTNLSHKLGPNVKEVFHPSLSFLFLIDGGCSR